MKNDLTGLVGLLSGAERVMFSQSREFIVPLIAPDAIEEGPRCVVCEGDWTVGAGVVSKIKE